MSAGVISRLGAARGPGVAEAADAGGCAACEALGTIEANLIDLYGKLGYDYPHDGAAASPAARGAAVKRERLA